MQTGIQKHIAKRKLTKLALLQNIYGCNFLNTTIRNGFPITVWFKWDYDIVLGHYHKYYIYDMEVTGRKGQDLDFLSLTRDELRDLEAEVLEVSHADN